MANAPKIVEQKLATFLKAWKDIRPDKAFGGLSLEQFEAIVKPSQDVRARMHDLQLELKGLIALRNTSDKTTLQAISDVANSVKGDRTEGADGELYGALGYVRKSERKRGLTRKKKKLPPEL